MKWITEYETDTQCQSEWWTISDSTSRKSFICYHKEDAEWLCNLLNSPQYPEQGVVFGEWQRCPVCYGNGQILEDGFISSVYQTCPTCEGNRIIQKPIIIPTH